MADKRWLPLFIKFLENLSIDSKEMGVVRLADVLYEGQHRFLEQVCNSIDEGIHNFVILKARQLGISTITLAIDLFWLAVHPGMQGALITDNEGNRDKFRIILERYLESLPREYKIKVTKHNRNNLVLSNGSVLDYLVAGTKKTGNLGRGRALNFIHATECSSWGDQEGVASLKASMAEEHPDRLYIFESTAKGFNLFWDMWKDAKSDPETQKPLFLGWWSKQNYRVKKSSAVFKKYWDGIYTEQEKELIAQVTREYDVKISDEQLAWYRWKEATQISGENMMQQEYPWTADQAFISTGKGFFNRRQITRVFKELSEDPPSFFAYRYHMGDDFLATDIEDLKKSSDDGEHITLADMELKVWEFPKSDAVYVIGVDPAYGSSDNKDRHTIEVWRCYADKIQQVAEYCTDNYESKQCAWVMCHLAGLYRNCMINYEVSGPGGIVKSELEHLQQLVQTGYLSNKAKDSGMTDMFGNVSWYLYHRPDSMGAGYAYGWKTSLENKFMIMNQYRDCFGNNMIMIKSDDLVSEMQTIVQDGSEIRGEHGKKDDRVMATALALEAWIKWIRPGLINRGETFEVIKNREEKKLDKTANFIAGIITNTFSNKDSERRDREFQRMWED